MDNPRLQHKRDRRSASIGVAGGHSFDADASALAVAEGEPRASYTVKDKHPATVPDRMMFARIVAGAELDPNTAPPANADVFWEAALISNVLWHVELGAGVTAEVYVWVLTEVEPGLEKWILVDTRLAIESLEEFASPTRMRPVFFQFVYTGKLPPLPGPPPSIVRASLGV